MNCPPLSTVIDLGGPYLMITSFHRKSMTLSYVILATGLTSIHFVK